MLAYSTIFSVPSYNLKSYSFSNGIVLVYGHLRVSNRPFFFDSAYDFGYLLKVLTADNLPAEESDFFDLLRLYFNNVYDIKYLMKSCKSLKGGLQEVAELLEVCLCFWRYEYR